MKHRFIKDFTVPPDRLCSFGTGVGEATIASAAIGTSALPAGVSYAAFAAPALTSTTTLAASGGMWAGIGSALSAAAPWLTVAGAGLSAASALQQGEMAAKQSQFQATIMEQQAQRERELAAQAEDDFRRQQSRLMASRRAILGGSGVEPGEGSPLLTTEDMASEIEVQAQRIRAGGNVEATRLSQQAALERVRGKAERSGGYMRAGASLLSGAGMAFGRSTKLAYS